MGKNYVFENYQKALAEMQRSSEKLEIIDEVWDDAKKSSIQIMVIEVLLTVLVARFVPSIVSIVAIAALFYNYKHFYNRIGGRTEFSLAILNIAYWGWLLVPIWLVDIAVAFAILMIGGASMIFCPILFLYFMKKSEQRKLDDAIRSIGIFKDMMVETSYQGGPATCPNCGAALKPGKPFCTQCGTKRAYPAIPFSGFQRN